MAQIKLFTMSRKCRHNFQLIAETWKLIEERRELKAVIVAASGVEGDVLELKLCNVAFTVTKWNWLLR